MLGKTRLLNPHSKSGDIERVTPVYYVIDAVSVVLSQKRSERRGRGSPGSHLARLGESRAANEVNDTIGHVSLLCNHRETEVECC